MKTFRNVGAFALTMLMICACLSAVAFTQMSYDEPDYTDFEPVPAIEQHQVAPEVAARPNRLSAARAYQRYDLEQGAHMITPALKEGELVYSGNARTSLPESSLNSFRYPEPGQEPPDEETCKHEHLMTYKEDGFRFAGCRDCGAIWEIVPPVVV